MNLNRITRLLPWMLIPITIVAVACGETKTETVVNTVVVEKEVVVEVEKEVSKIVVATPTPTQDELAAAAKTGGHLRVASVGSVQSFDPLWTTASSTGNVSSMILEGLFGYKEDYTIGKVLVDDWSVSADGLTWTFSIREGVSFHDGTPLTTDQVVGTLRRQSERAPVFKLVWEQFGPADFDDFIKVVDDYSFSVNLTEQTGLVIDALGPQNFTPQIVPQSWYTLPATESAEGTPIGTGPYRFESWTPGDRWTAIPFEDYAASSEPTDGETGAHAAYFDRVSYIEIPDQATRVAALQTDAVDMVQEFSQDLIDRLKADSNVQLIANPPFRLLGHFNYQIPPFNDPEWGQKLRQAVVMAYDNEKALLAAAGTADRINLCPSLMQCGTAWESSAGSEGRYNANNIEAAKKIVTDSGYEGYTIKLMDPADRQPAHGAAQVTREVLEDIGFKVDFRVMDWATMVQDRATVDRWEFFHTWSGASVRTGPVGHLRFGELQYDAWFNKYTDTAGTQRRIFDELARETDQTKVKELMEEFHEYFYEDAIFLQVGEFFSNWAASNQIEGLHGNPGGQKPYDKWFK